MSNTNLVEVLNSTPITTSVKVAQFFGKEHSKVLRDVENLLKKDQELKANFGLSDYLGENNLLGERHYKMYTMDKDGFTLLAMGFTGAKALSFKKAYIKAFNEIANQLVQAKPKTTLELLKDVVFELEAKEKENLLLAKENSVLANRDLEVKTQKEYKWKKQEIQNDRGRTINYYVEKYFLPQVPNTFINSDGIELTYTAGAKYALAHNLAKLEFSVKNYKLPKYARDMSMEQKKDYLIYLSSL